MKKEITSRQTEIIEAAAKLLTNSGVSGLTIKNLAKEMNFSESAIYRHFTSKEEIILAMLTFVLEHVDENYISTSKTDLNATEKFKLVFKSQFEFFQNKPHLAVAIFSDGLLEESILINEKILHITTTRKKLIEPIILEGQQTGLFRTDLNGDDLIHIIMGSVRLQMYKWRVGQFQFDITKSGHQLIESLLKLVSVK